MSGKKFIEDSGECLKSFNEQAETVCARPQMSTKDFLRQHMLSVQSNSSVNPVKPSPAPTPSNHTP